MKKLVTFTLLLFFYSIAFSQDLMIKSGPKGLYLEHKVAAKEGLFPLGRMYNVHPRHIANFNGIDFNKGLAIGQIINIPLSDTNYSTKSDKGVPIYYHAAETENVANISTKYKSSFEKLQFWNNMPGGSVQKGTKLVVGFLITNELKDRVVTITPKSVVVEEKKQPIPEKKDVIIEESVSNVKKAEDLKKQTDEPKKDISKTEPLNQQNEIKKEEPPVLIKEEPKKNEPVVVKPEIIKEEGTGYFKSNFYQQVKASPLTKDQTVTSSIFKTQSGWQDGKYYLLINGVEPGTIVKITNPSNSKTVYAKVLYAMDKIRQNQGVDIRISDAAASSLAVSETDKFILKVSY